MRIYVNQSPVLGPWGGGNLWVTAIHDAILKLGYQMPTGSVELPDVIFISQIQSIEHILRLKMQAPTVKLILRVNENDARKGTIDVDQTWIRLSEHVDATVFVSHWLKDYFMQKGWRCQNNHVIYNGVDRTLFKPNNKLDNGKINIVAHHWSNNRMKGFDIYEKLDNFVIENSDFSFTYIGRENGTFRNTQVIQPLFGKQLGDELGRYDVYVSASRWDPGPNHILESLACNLPTYVHIDGGGAVEFAGNTHTFDNWEQLQHILLNKKFKNNEAITLLDWKTCVSQYMTLAERLNDNAIQIS